jgi:carboxyl-terminal processing protease
MLPPTDPAQTPAEPSLTPEPAASPMAPPVANASPVAPASSSASSGGGRRWLRRAVIAAVLVATFTVGVGVGRVAPLSGLSPATPGATGGTSAQEFDLIRQAWDTLHREYVGRADLDDRELAYGAIRGLTEAVGDTGHTSFLTPEERAAKADELSGSYVGVGIRLDAAEDGSPLVVGVFKGSPAEAAGVLTGDVIEAVDGKPTTGHELDEIAGWVRGEAGSSVELTVRAKGGPARTYKITRADVPIESVSWTLVPGTKTALLRLDSFSHGSADDIVVALKDIQKAGAERLVLDLRGNPGGFVGEATGIASQFIRSGDVYVERDADGNETRHPVSPDGVALDLPLDVLVDQGTASSAEILSGALQDAGRAQIVGVGTFGTGTVLGEFELSDGSALRIGTVEWLTPKGRRIWHEGIAPDIVVERPSDVTPLTPDQVRDMTPAAVSSMMDPQLARALSVVASTR